MNSNPQIDLSGRVAIVTGAGKGIGQACAIAFAERGAKVVLNSRSRAPLEETVKLIEEIGGQAAYVVGDVSEERVAKETVALALKRFARLDYAVNNAGVSPWVGNLADCSFEDWKRVVDINLTGTWLGMKYQLQALAKGDGGAIVNMSSVAALSTFEGYGPYSASKWGVVGITRVAAREFASKGIRVNAIAPGAIDTPLMQEVVQTTPHSRDDYAKRVPMGRIAKSKEVAAAAVWLCSDNASYVTGALLPVDGGMTL